MPTAPKRFSFHTPAKREAWSHNGKTTTQRGYGWDHQKARARLLRDEPLCRECRKNNRTTIATIADHVRPLAEGGARDASNLQPLCKLCSDAKTAEEARRGAERAR
jgi:5-methylcytosine-specific restriction protein A